MDRIQLVENALNKCETLMHDHPSAGPFEYVTVQLRYVLALLKGEDSDRSRLKNINIGLIALREFDTRFPEFSDCLMAVEKIVEDMRFGR